MYELDHAYSFWTPGTVDSWSDFSTTTIGLIEVLSSVVVKFKSGLAGFNRF